MADLTDLQAAQSVKIAGANTSGVEDNYLDIDSNQAAKTTLRDPTSGVGVTTDNPGTAGNQRLHVATPDTTIASATLGALNAAATIVVSGLTGVGFQINAGTFIGTLTPEISIDGGTTWIATNFYDITGQDILFNYTFSSSNTTKILTVLTIGGTSHARVRVSSYTSGSATSTMRASHGTSVSVVAPGAGGGGAAFSVVSNTTPSIPNNTATLIVSANASRKYLMISNPSGSLAYIALGNTTGLTTGQGIPVPARSFFELKGDNLFTGAIYAISGSSITFYICEGTP